MFLRRSIISARFYSASRFWILDIGCDRCKEYTQGQTDRLPGRIRLLDLGGPGGRIVVHGKANRQISGM
jgi:hypothetical protein